MWIKIVYSKMHNSREVRWCPRREVRGHSPRQAAGDIYQTPVNNSYCSFIIF